MRELPILFSGALVRAILAGTKTVTRRPVRRENEPDPGKAWDECLCREIDPSDRPCIVCDARFGACPFGAAGDRLWARETFHADKGHAPDDYPSIHYAADLEERQHDGRSISPPNERRSTHKGPWTPSIHMPRWASRIVLEVTAVTIERLQDITELDAKREGVEGICDCAMCRRDLTPCFDDADERLYVPAFAAKWREIYGAESWDANGWVWRVAFKRIEVA